jgi:hypothetical protein
MDVFVPTKEVFVILKRYQPVGTYMSSAHSGRKRLLFASGALPEVKEDDTARCRGWASDVNAIAKVRLKGKISLCPWISLQQSAVSCADRQPTRQPFQVAA